MIFEVVCWAKNRAKKNTHLFHHLALDTLHQRNEECHLLHGVISTSRDCLLHLGLVLWDLKCGNGLLEGLFGLFEVELRE